MTCTKCRQNNAAEARFCTNCGARLEGDAGPQPGARDDARREELIRGTGRGNFRVAFAWTAIPIVALGIISTAGASADGFYSLWFYGAGLGVLALLVAIGFAIARKGRAASGILAGIGVGILALALTCFANLSTIDF